MRSTGLRAPSYQALELNSTLPGGPTPSAQRESSWGAALWLPGCQRWQKQAQQRLHRCFCEEAKWQEGREIGTLVALACSVFQVDIIKGGCMTENKGCKNRIPSEVLTTGSQNQQGYLLGTETSWGQPGGDADERRHFQN